MSVQKPPTLPHLEYTNYTAQAHETSSITRLISNDLTEPYSIFTYRYFLSQWPDLCILCYKKTDQEYNSEKDIVACVVNKIERKTDAHPLRGYIAMLAVHTNYRYCGIGTELIKRTIQQMRDKGCQFIFLETPVQNEGALRLYENLGFVREKRLVRYYMGGEDAYRLKLVL